MSSKKILILTVGGKTKAFASTRHEKSLLVAIERLNEQHEDLQFFVAAIDELHIRIKNGEASILDTRNKQDLCEYQLVHGLNVAFLRDYFQAVALYLRHHNVAFMNASDVEGTPFDKISQMMLFALNGVSVPDTLAVWGNAMYRDTVRETYTLPFICKSNNGTKGNDNYLIESWEQFDQLLADKGMEGYVVQPFIPNEGDYRILYLGDARLIIYRKSGGSSHLNNTSQGGDGHLLQPTDCSPDVLDIAARAIQLYDRKIGGVDVLVHKHTNTPYVLEINNTPAILSGVFLEDKSSKYAALITEELQKVEGVNI
ncbi:MAG TPA: hypothetical protein VLH38_02840 [Patescibacteria group bacterium]|nr:hypothetical protein [Patescibacteria group bacterium]